MDSNSKQYTRIDAKRQGLPQRLIRDRKQRGIHCEQNAWKFQRTDTSLMSSYRHVHFSEHLTVCGVMIGIPIQAYKDADEKALEGLNAWL